jgi:murein DD-endopeptidase MepM/ murein hydrolase activator NlpD
MMENALKVDSLEQEISRQLQYLNNINAILRGDSPVSEIPDPDTTSVHMESLKKSDKLTEFVRNFEEEEKYNLNVLNSSTALPENLIFYRPIRGLISSHFNSQEKHYGIDIAATPKESVLATMKGTVVFAGFDANGGYIIQIQHSSGFVSIYKHNAILLKKQGDEVNAGEAIAIVGNSGNLSSGTHLHFELWYQGKPLDPEEFIVF